MEKYFIKRVPYYTTEYREQRIRCKKYCKNHHQCLYCDKFFSKYNNMPHKDVLLSRAPLGNIIFPSGGHFFIDIDKKCSMYIGSNLFYKVAVHFNDREYPIFHITKDGIIQPIEMYIDETGVLKHPMRIRYQSIFKGVPKILMEKCDTKYGSIGSIDLNKLVMMNIRKTQSFGVSYHAKLELKRRPDCIYQSLVQFYDETSNKSSVSVDNFVVWFVNFIRERYNIRYEIRTTKYTKIKFRMNKNYSNFSFVMRIPCYKKRSTNESFIVINQNQNLSDIKILCETGLEYCISKNNSIRIGSHVLSKIVCTFHKKEYPIFGVHDGRISEVNIYIDNSCLVRPEDVMLHTFPKIQRFINTTTRVLNINYRRLMTYIMDYFEYSDFPNDSLKMYDPKHAYRSLVRWNALQQNASKITISNFSKAYIKNVLIEPRSVELTKCMMNLNKTMFDFIGGIKSFNSVRVEIPFANPYRYFVSLSEIINSNKEIIYNMIYDKLEEYSGIPKGFFKMTDCIITSTELLVCTFNLKELTD